MKRVVLTIRQGRLKLEIPVVPGKEIHIGAYGSSRLDVSPTKFRNSISITTDHDPEPCKDCGEKPHPGRPCDPV